MPIRSKRASFQIGCTILALGFWLVSRPVSKHTLSHALAAPPRQTYAPLSVIISEIAWSGTAASANDEWIELYNPSPMDIALTGWRLVADDGSPSIALTGTIRAGEFYLLERTDDDTISNIPADQIYSGALNNAGEVLRLKAPDNGDIDTANADDGSWPAGSAAPDYYSMERRDLVPDAPSAWASNNGIIRNGEDANGNPINGTPKQFNSQWPATPIPTETLIPTETPTLTETPTFTPSPSFTPTPTSTPTRTATNTPPAPLHLVISEFRTRGPNGGNDEFVEIFNPTGGTVDVSGWSIKKSSGCGSTVTTLLTISNGVLLKPGQHFLAVASGISLAVSADQTFSPGIADDGGLALVSNAGTIVDRVGMCSETLYYEGLPLPPMTGNVDRSYARQPAGQGCYDVNNNALDFALLSPPQPQNRASPLTLCAGVVTFTPSRTPTTTPTHTPTASPTPLPAAIVINEFLPFPRADWNGDGVLNTGDEYIELMNVSSETVSLKGWKLDDEEDGSLPYSLPEQLLLPGEIVRFFGSQTKILLSNGGDSVRLFHPIGRIVDAFTYPAVESADVTWCRLPDGKGTFDFKCRPTPGRPNAPIGGQDRPPRGSQESPKVCPVPQSAPASIALAECELPGFNIWNWTIGREEVIWLDDHYRWPVFIK